MAPQKSETTLVDRQSLRFPIVAYQKPRSRVGSCHVSYIILNYPMPRTRALPGPPKPRGPIPTAPREFPSPPTAQPQRRNCELDVNLRTQIITLKEVAKWSYSQIRKKYPHIPLSTIKTICLWSRIRQKEESRKRPGRLKILNEDDRQKIL